MQRKAPLLPITDTPTPTETPTVTMTPTVTETPTVTPTSTPTETPSPTPSPTATATPTVTALPPTATQTAVPATQTPVPTATPIGFPDKPPLAVIVYNRLAYGPRAGDLDAFNALGATDDARLTAWLAQQLNPGSINDTDCTNRVGALGLPTLPTSDGMVLPSYWSGVSTGGGGPIDPSLNRTVYLPNVMKPGLVINDDANSVLQTHWREYYRRPNKTGEFSNDRPLQDIRIATVTRAVFSKRQLYEVMVEFWHNHFSIFAWEGYARWTWVHYDRYVIRKHAMGNFRQMLGDVAKSPAMLYYLDNYINTRGGPNENWARELFELHGLGAENYLGVKGQSEVPKDGNNKPVGYVDDDVYESTRCFTGWTVDDVWGSDTNPSSWGTGVFKYDDADHDRFQKTILGQFISADTPPEQDGKTVLDLIANHPGAARYVCRRLCRRLISDTPSETTVDAVAAVFIANVNAPDQIKKVLETIIKSDEFRNSYALKVKRPYESTMGVLRATNVQLNWTIKLKTTTDAQGNVYKNWEQPSDEFFYYYDGLGQSMFARRPPDGWGDRYTNWTNSTSILMRWNMANFVLYAGAKRGNDATANDKRMVINLLNQLPATRTPNAVVDFWIARVLGRDMPAASRTQLVQILANGRNPATYILTDKDVNDRLPAVLALILSSPEFNWR